MRTITNITIQKEENTVTMFLTYNNDSNDYSFTGHSSIKDALNSLPKNDPYFPIKTDKYRFLEIKGNKTIQDKTISLNK